MFFNKEGILDIDDLLADNPSFKSIMADGIVTECELNAQADRVLTLLKHMESKYQEDQLKEIKELMIELSAMYAAYNVYTLQNINNI